jgi:glycosyltransferase involved in cell wall biosynthesis
MVLAEAMALERPVVATNHGAFPEIVRDRETGLLIPPNDVGALAEALLWLLQHPSVAQQMGTNGRSRVESHFSISQMARSFERAYAKVGHLGPVASVWKGGFPCR